MSMRKKTGSIDRSLLRSRRSASGVSHHSEYCTSRSRACSFSAVYCGSRNSAYIPFLRAHWPNWNGFLFRPLANRPWGFGASIQSFAPLWRRHRGTQVRRRSRRERRKVGFRGNTPAVRVIRGSKALCIHLARVRRFSFTPPENASESTPHAPPENQDSAARSACLRRIDFQQIFHRRFHQNPTCL